MIQVDELRDYGALWKGGMSCHMNESEGNVTALLAFADRIELPRRWFQPCVGRPYHAHFDLSPKWRERAIAAGAVFVPAMEQARARRDAGILYGRRPDPPATTSPEAT